MIRRLGKTLFRLIGWRLENAPTALKKCVVILTPHTSNWDFMVALFGRAHITQPVRFLGKHQLFFFPLSLFMRALGGIPVNRTKHNNLVDFTVDLFDKEKELFLTIAPEGTRRPVTQWKLGFYYIAQKANVPIVIMGLDYQTKIISFSSPIIPSNNMQKDFELIHAFASKIKGRHQQDLPSFTPR
jgi:1-acyl-sn-glycerol-3-phosphate acyltransferase